MSSDRKEATATHERFGERLETVEQYHAFIRAFEPIATWTLEFGGDSDNIHLALRKNAATAMQFAGIGSLNLLTFIRVAEDSVLGGRVPSEFEKWTYHHFRDTVNFSAFPPHKTIHPAFALSEQPTG